jgi:AraC-like DNA-binding protein
MQLQYEGHLSLNEVELPASTEQPFTSTGWCIIRLNRGAGYCFQAKEVTELAAGELLVVPPAKSVVLRASQIGVAKLHYFNFHPELLGSFLTLPEQEQFAELAGSPDRKVCHLPATNEIAARFAAICENPTRGNRLLETSLMLELVATLFTRDLKEPPQASSPSFTAEACFLDLVEKTPEAAILNYSAAELAHRCKCNQRYFSRLFRAHFGVSFRSKQAQLRLERARQLLLESDISITDVATACGYHNQRVFCGMFKIRFGITPAKLRRQIPRRSPQQ